MNVYLTAVSLGMASGLLVIGANRVFWLGWLMLAPLCAAIYLSPPAAAGMPGFCAASSRSRPPRGPAGPSPPTCR